MFKNIVCLTVMLSLGLACLGFAPPAVRAGDNNNDPYGLNTTAGEAKEGLVGVEDEDNDTPDIAATLGSIVNALLSLVGILFMILVIWAGIRWMLARGNTEEVKKARDLLIHSVIGLAIVLSAYIIVNFVLNLITGSIAE